MTHICSLCGKKINGKIYPDNTCQGCYKYVQNGGTFNMPPAAGEIAYDERGHVICHICGRAYKRLGSHIRESHGMTISEYKEEFGLCNNAKTTEQHYSEHMKELAYINGMPERLQKTGKNTRIKKGEKEKRKGKPVRLQECLDRSKRYKNKRSCA